MSAPPYLSAVEAEHESRAHRPPPAARLTCFNDYAALEDAAETVSARSARILAKCRKRPLPEGARKHISAGVCACP